VLLLELYGDNYLSRLLSSLGRLFPIPHLTRVALTHVRNNGSVASAFADFLARHTTIVDLSFSKCHKAVIEVLSSPPNAHLCPLLTKLTIRDCAIRATKFDEIVSIRIRPSNIWEEVECLQQREVTRCSHITHAMVLKFEKDMVVVYK